MYCSTSKANLCVLCYHLFNLDAEIVNMEDSVSTIFKSLKPRKITFLKAFVG